MSRRIQGVVFHYTDSGPETTVADVRSWHVKGRGWRDIGYHRVILHPESREFQRPPRNWWDLVKVGRHLNDDSFIDANEIGAHEPAANRTMPGVAVVNRPGLKLHPLQEEAIIQVAKIFASRFKYPIRNTHIHRDFRATGCPGEEIARLVNRIRAGEL